MLTTLLLTFLQPQSATNPPQELTSATFQTVRDYVRLTPSETLYQTLEWHARVFDGIQAARKSDRPLLLWMYFGDPQGQC